MATWGTGISLKGGKGDAGLSVLTGSGPPANTLGFDTQVYIDTATFDAYLRTNGQWQKQLNLRGPAGLSGLNAQFLHGVNPPTTSTFTNDSDAIYLQDSGEVWYFDFEGTKVWTDSGTSFRGPAGSPGVAGLRGTQTYTGNGAPSSNLASFTPPAVAGDLYYDVGPTGGPTLYVLGS